MTATEPTRQLTPTAQPARMIRAWATALAGWRPTEADIRQRLPVAIAMAVGVGLVAIVMSTPIAGRGDFGQWLMASRFYLGQPIPDYRDVAALPPLVPVLLAGIRMVIPDPVIALEILNGLVLGVC